MSEITKEQALEAIDILERYRAQLLKDTIQDEINEDKRRIDILGLDTRTLNSLEDADINTVGELLSIGRRQLIRLRNMGNKGISL